MSESAFQSLVAPARHRPQLWRLVLGLILAGAIYVGFISALIACVALLYPDLEAIARLQSIAQGDSPAAALILLASFAGMGLGAMAATRLLHRRPATSLFGPGRRVLRDFVNAVAVVALVYAVYVVVWARFFESQPAVPLDAWLRLLPLALLGVLIQTGAEELLFRGYLMQQLAARFRNPLIWMFVPVIAFGAVHYDPGNGGDNTWFLVGAATVFGLLAADLTMVSGSIGAAWGFHFANNSFALLILATQGTITGLALELTPYHVADAATARPLIAADIGVMALGWLLVRWRVGRRR